MGPTEVELYCRFFSTYLSLGRDHTAFDGGVKAIYNALQQLTYQPSAFSKVVILSDSQAAISAISNLSNTSIYSDILDCKKLIRNLINQNKNMILQWIPSHCGIPGNEMADTLAKKGTDTSPYHSEVPYPRASTIIHRKIKETHQNVLQGIINSHTWKDQITSVPDWPEEKQLQNFD